MENGASGPGHLLAIGDWSLVIATLVEPEAVAASPNRIKSPVPVFCGFGSAQTGAGERSRTVVSALARPHSAVEPHPPELVSPAGLSPATWSLGGSRSVL